MKVLDKHKIVSYCFKNENGYWTNKETISTCPSRAKRIASIDEAKLYMQLKQLDKKGFAIKPIIIGYIVYD